MIKQKADALITEYLPKIYGFAVSKSFSYDEAEDLCSDIVNELYRSLLAADKIYNVDGYVWRISAHVYSKFVSSKKKHQGISIDGMDIPFHDEYFSDEDEDLLRLRREISFLTKVRREIVYSYYYENKSIAAISSAMNLPVGTVKWHLNKARNDLKEGFVMERKIGKLGLKPIKATGFGHSGNPGANGGPEFYLGDSLNLNIVYSVYREPKTTEEIAEELGATPVLIEEKIDFLERNGFLVKQSKNRYTTYVSFDPETYSLEETENTLKKQREVAKLLAKDYTQSIRKAIADYPDVYIPGGNKELLEAAAIIYGVINKCTLPTNKDLSKYYIKTTDGGDFITYVHLPSERIDKDYVPTLEPQDLTACGNMNRLSEKYPVYSWSVDTKFCSREGLWKNNLLSDYEYLYEFMTGEISDTPANADKFKRLRERKFITPDNKVNIMVIKGKSEGFFGTIPSLDDIVKKEFAGYALESAEVIARSYPPQMRDLIISTHAGNFVSNSVAVMVMDILYKNGTFKPLTENERVTSDLIMFCDRLPDA
ncbi:MAG: hypothetical protein HDT13_01525 [Butyrivibrio sp.]|nr:hypothetical protein [Butyrivibrio sp.]